MRSSSLSLLVVVTAVVGLLAASEPRRTDGLSVHLLPEQVAQLMGRTGGFQVDRQVTAETPKFFAGAEQLFDYMRTLPATVRANGVWVVITNPSAYAASELDVLVTLGELCKKEDIPLFVARASELPNGWRRRN